jgi:hypothetical protein
MTLKITDKVEIVCDEDSREKRDWFICKSPEGFQLRSYKRDDNLCFNNSELSRSIVKQFAPGKMSIGFVVATTPTIFDGVDYYAILTGSGK